MLDTFPTPVLAITDAVDDLEGVEALSSLYTLVSKCKAGLKDGQRLENLSWRLWYRLEKMPTTLTTLRPPLTDPRTHSIKGDNPTNSNALAASAYQSPAPSVASIYSPSPSTISFSDSSISISSSNDSDSGSERSLREGQQQPLPHKQEERVEQGDSQQQRGQQVQQQQQNETEPHDHHRAISGHIPSPITSPSPVPVSFITNNIIAISTTVATHPFDTHSAATTTVTCVADRITISTITVTSTTSPHQPPRRFQCQSPNQYEWEW
ncbi:hypothetical protein ONZ45_g14643 [Pleurotus djamor]|nr:hypothetical protein ONZ45_g14643 [Pleurotus djamor]